MAEAALVDEDQAVRMPDSLTFEQGAVIEPAAVAWAAVRTGDVGAGQHVLVSGVGPIGALAALAAAAAGADAVVREPNPGRAAHVADLGFEVLDPHAVDIVRECVECGSGGIDVAIECSGRESALQAALRSLWPGGRVVQTGLPTRPATFDVASLVLRGLSMLGSVGYRLRSWSFLTDEVGSCRLAVERIITGYVGLADAVRNGFERLLDPTDAVKILVNINS